MKFYATFGYGQIHFNKYVEIEAENRDKAKLEMFRIFGQNWSMLYSEDKWTKDGKTKAEEWDWTKLQDL